MIRVATPHDTRAIAALIDRAGQVQRRSLYSDRFPGRAADRIKQIECVVRAPDRSRFHWSRFWVAEVRGRVIAALACYDWANVGPIMEPLAAPAPPVGTWMIDHAARFAEGEGGSLLSQLLTHAVREGAQSGFCHACIDVHSHNDELVRVCESAGFFKRTEYVCGFTARPDGYRVERFWRSLR